ncbi:DUF1850 domain-containing protein [Aminiphilus sp.]|uniref:DUF1850 domain-containing protein n=1 Tax=Aminiphilus sp. TaxID=1872488 RepID=UPI002618D079|nr:DUF1850 domain-containing protein [Aminiphilus sp.]
MSFAKRAEGCGGIVELKKSSFSFMLRSIEFSIAVVLVFLACIVLFSAPVPFLVVTNADTTLLTYPILPGQFIVTRYIHSVELTPVEDVFVARGGVLWQWEERVKSHNAGLPVAPSRNGRFLARNGWFVFQGGRAHFPMIHYRVGTAELGANELLLPPSIMLKLYERVPQERLRLFVEMSPLVGKNGGSFVVK